MYYGLATASDMENLHEDVRADIPVEKPLTLILRVAPAERDNRKGLVL
jgi:hypothetical protein